jgi:parvulin-like peptidyl-prolyl isomerase
MRQEKLIAGMLLSTGAGLLLSGCWTGGVYQVPGKESLASDLTAESTPRVARLQQVGPAGPNYRPQAAPPPLPPSPTGTKQVSLTAARNVRVNVRAWVNGKPIFDEEVMQSISGSVLRELGTMPEPQRSERLTEAYNQSLDSVIEQEIAYQDAVRKLEASNNKKALKSLEKYAEEKYEEQLKRIRDTGKVSEDQIKEFAHVIRRQTKRGIISGEYMRSRIIPITFERASLPEIKKYYDEHLNEFQRLDTVRWQDVFIAVGPKFPTVAVAKRFAEDLIAQVRTDADFAKLHQFDEGDSKFRNGEGLGSRRGEIKPPEVEDELFRLREGEIGRVIELSTGVHIVKVTKREYAGVIPLDEKTQNMIRNKIRNEVFEREYKRIIRELKSRATIEIERDAP